MDYKELLEQQELNSPEEACDWMNRADEAIRELVARCKRLDEARKRANEAAHQWEGRCKILETRLETAEKMVKEYQDVIVPGYRERAEKAERELKIAIGGLVGQCKYCGNNQKCTSRKGPHIYCWEWCGEKEEWPCFYGAAGTPTTSGAAM